MKYVIRDWDFEKRFWERISGLSITECWNWTASKKKDGYGQVKFEGRMQLSHRISYSLAIGKIPTGLKVLHHCDNPPCCNPFHFFLGTDADNSADKISKGRDRHAVGSKVAQSKFTEAQVLEIRASHVPYKNSANKIAKQLGVHKSSIEKILQRITWQHV